MARFYKKKKQQQQCDMKVTWMNFFSWKHACGQIHVFFLFFFFAAL